MAGSGAPGVNTSATPMLLQDRDVGVGDDAAHQDQDVAAALVREAVDDPGDEGEMGARQQREPHGVGVLLDDRLDHLLGGLVEPGVDDLEAGVPEGPGDDLGAAVVPVEPGLGHHHSIRALHGGRY